MVTLYITSKQTRAGKTALAGALGRELIQRGKRVGYYKPFTMTPEGDQDTAFMEGTVLGLPAQSLPLPEPMSTQHTRLDRATWERLKTNYDTQAQEKDFVIVEGPSLETPVGDTSSLTKELAELLGTRVLLVLPYSSYLGAEDIAEICHGLGSHFEAVLLNFVARYKFQEVKEKRVPALEAQGIKVLGAIPEDRRLLALTTGELAERLKGQWLLGQEKSSLLVEHFLMGGFIMEWGVNYFGRKENKAVITRGDRPDLQMAALETPTSCLILTGGQQPIQYVYYEAQQREVPVILLEKDTLETAEDLARVLDGANFHHPDKLQRFHDLLRDHGSLKAIPGL